MGYYKVRINVKDQHNNPVVGAKATLTKDGRGQGYPNSFTDSNGNAYFYDVVSGIQFMYKVVAPTGYSCVTCAKLHTLSDKDIWTQMEMKKAAAPNYNLHVVCEDQNNNKLQNVAITINNVHRGYTSSAGTFAVSLPGDQQYDVKGVKSGHENGFDSVYLSSTKVVDLILKRPEEPEPEPEPEPDPEPWPETFDMYIHVNDDNGIGVVGVNVSVNDRSVGNTGTGGNVTCYRVAGTYNVEATPPSGYTCIKCTETVNLTSNTHVYLKIQGESKICRVAMRVTDQNNLQVDATVNMNGESKRLYSKPEVYFDVEQGKSYPYIVTADRCTTAKGTYTAPMAVGDTKFIKMACEVMEYAYVSCYVKGTDGEYHAGVEVYCDATNETKTTTSAGRVSFQMQHDVAYTITVTPPTGYTCDCWNCVCEQSGVADKDYDPKLPFRYGPIEVPEPDVWTIYAPDRVAVGEKFEVTMVKAPASQDPSDYIEIKTDKELIPDPLDPVIGKGTSDVEGHASIDCVVPGAGTYEIYAYYPGSIFPGGERSANSVAVVVGEGVDEITLVAPSIVMAESEFIVSGKHPKPGQTIDIKIDKNGLFVPAVDPVIATVVVGMDGTYEATCQIDEFSYRSIYAYDPTWVEEWFWLIPPGWIPGKGLRSNSERVLVITTPILLGLIAILALIAEKKYNIVGVFK